MVANWLADHATSIVIWCGAISTFAIYSVLYTENRFYRFFEHLLIGFATGYGVYITWTEVLYPKWWQPMVMDGHWYWVFAAMLGSMFYFMYSRKHAWVSRIIFGLFMGLAAGGMFRELYELYFPQIGASMKPLAGTLPSGDKITIWGTLGTVIFYVILLASMSYFFFSFEHKSATMKRTAAAGRWFLMIGFGAIFGATVMGRMTLFIGRFNFLLNDWGRRELARDWSYLGFRIGVIAVAAAAVALLIWYFTRPRKAKAPESE